jgi:hypothetical protein
MKVKDIIKHINKSKEFEQEISICSFAMEVFDLHYIDFYNEQNRLKCFFLTNWYCTDTYVGKRVYFLDGEPVAISNQIGRKYDEKFTWVSKEAYDKTKNYILSFATDPEIEIDILEENDEMQEFYKVEFYSQMFKHHKENAYYKGDKVKVLKSKESHNDKGFFVKETVEILFEDGKTLWINTNEIDFKINARMPFSHFG